MFREPIEILDCDSLFNEAVAELYGNQNIAKANLIIVADSECGVLSEKANLILAYAYGDTDADKLTYRFKFVSNLLRLFYMIYLPKELNPAEIMGL